MSKVDVVAACRSFSIFPNQKRMIRVFLRHLVVYYPEIDLKEVMYCRMRQWTQLL